MKVGRKYGVKSTASGRFVFGIMEGTPERAADKLFARIKHDAYSWRFSVVEMTRIEKRDMIREKEAFRASRDFHVYGKGRR